jgi:hypothetical protein
MKPMTLFRYVSLLILLTACTGAANAQAPLSAVDHFRCYPFPAQSTNQVVVKLQDQFTTTPLTAVQITPLEFCNPVQKTRADGTTTPILNPNHHFVMYRIALPSVLRQATISNQFGNNQVLTLLAPTVLAVPAAIPPLTVSPDLDHYECYAVQAQPFNLINIPVGLQDAFLTETVTVLQPALFCNPTVKSHGSVNTVIQHPLSHLTCYTTSASVFTGGTVNTTDQFFALTLAVGRPDLLCVPSLKLSWQLLGE